VNVLDLSYNFASLSLHDLLQARDLYHYHLMSKVNVIGTAVGLYLIRKDEPWPKGKGEGKNPPDKKSYARTFANSEVRDYSWPCVLAIVHSWVTEAEFGGGGSSYNPAQSLPKTLYMPDGRAVPVCVVEAHEVPSEDGFGMPPAAGRPAYKLGGGMPIIVHVQGVENYATAGCLVTDGHLIYALTARHACGDAGTVIASQLRGGIVEVGVSSDKQITRKEFSKVYEDFPGRRSYVSLDVGLIRVNVVEDWTSNTYGLPPIGPLADVHEGNLSLKFIDQTVIGQGAASGLLRGAIKALFYRHRSVGGFDYVADFLISPTHDVSTRRGDSGMVWHLDVTEDPKDGEPKPLSERDLRPLAVEWGGQVFEDGGSRNTFAVATSLSNVCKLLDVELVTDLSRGVSDYWGRTGHYSIAAFATRLVGDGHLKTLLAKNLETLSFDLATIAKKGFDKMVGQLSGANKFVPLADVPDEIWKKLDHGRNAREGGRDISGGKHGSDGPEHPTHFADIDAPIGPQGQTWRALCLANDDNITVPAWKDFYVKMAAKAEADGDAEAAKQYRTLFKQGLLPFRLWQFYDAMVEFARQGDVVGYLTAAGIAAHYMGDASQPLHGSIFADGDPSRTVERNHPRTGKTETVRFGEGVHSAYETAMLALKAPELFTRIGDQLPAGATHGLALCSSGKEIAKATLQLMDKVATILKPMDIVESYEAAGASTRQATLNAMWEELGDGTAKVMAQGSRYLAMLWESAWIKGNGPAIPAGKLTELDQGEVRERYINVNFVPSLALNKIDAVLKK
jgi:hypothetical protein